MSEFRPGRVADQAAVLKFYEEVIDAQEGAGPQWHKGVYPTDYELLSHLCSDRMYLWLEEGEIAAAGVLLMHEDPEYLAADQWPERLMYTDVAVLHLLAVHPKYRRQGIASVFLQLLFEVCRQEGKKAVHLDVLPGNAPAEELYKSVGFQYVQDLKVHYEDLGDTVIRLYEYRL